jgi:hypothetical protein
MRRRIVTDSISIIAVSDAVKNSLIVKSPFLNASVVSSQTFKIGANVAHWSLDLQ